ncbi:MAG: TRAP transporter substrate-binding protein DctP [Rubrivivax sp.]|nr:TRAP transporter substrate-binding protein DctP [Burkholderiales bacterium]MCW5633497.1 TRAP transporter substrate-binding protein DctP [Rubrivivax sp.]
MNRLFRLFRTSNRACAIAALATVALMPTLSLAQASGKMVLRVADQFPQGHFVPRYGIKPWMEAVTRATNGEVQFEHYPAEQLGKAKDLLTVVQNGVADIVLFAPSYASDKMPLTAALELPGLFDTSCKGSQVFAKLAAPEGILGRQEYAPNGVRVLFAAVYPPYQMVSAKRSIATLKDVDGMKLRVLGGAMDLTVRRMGGVPVRMASTEAFEAISRGTLDGAIFSYGVTTNYNIPTKFATAGKGFGSAAAVFIVSESRWKQWPEHVRKAMTDAGVEAGASLCAGMDKEETVDQEKLRAKGVSIVRWSEADVAALSQLLGQVANDWAAELDKRGKPGSEVLKATLAARGSR